MVCNKETCRFGFGDHEVRFWFALDVNRKPKYPGFDFVSAKGKFRHGTDQFLLLELHLIQVTTSWASKTQHQKSIMVVQYNKCVEELEKKKCINMKDNKHDPHELEKVKCYICLPNDSLVKGPLVLQDNKQQISKVQASVITTLDFPHL